MHRPDGVSSTRSLPPPPVPETVDGARGRSNEVRGATTSDVGTEKQRSGTSSLGVSGADHAATRSLAATADRGCMRYGAVRGMENARQGPKSILKTTVQKSPIRNIDTGTLPISRGHSRTYSSEASPPSKAATVRGSSVHRSPAVRSPTASRRQLHASSEPTSVAGSPKGTAMVRINSMTDAYSAPGDDRSPALSGLHAKAGHPRPNSKDRASGTAQQGPYPSPAPSSSGASSPIPAPRMKPQASGSNLRKVDKQLSASSTKRLEWRLQVPRNAVGGNGRQRVIRRPRFDSPTLHCPELSPEDDTAVLTSPSTSEVASCLSASSSPISLSSAKSSVSEGEVLNPRRQGRRVAWRNSQLESEIVYAQDRAIAGSRRRRPRAQTVSGVSGDTGRANESCGSDSDGSSPPGNTGKHLLSRSCGDSRSKLRRSASLLSMRLGAYGQSEERSDARAEVSRLLSLLSLELRADDHSTQIRKLINHSDFPGLCRVATGKEYRGTTSHEAGREDGEFGRESTLPLDPGTPGLVDGRARDVGHVVHPEIVNYLEWLQRRQKGRSPEPLAPRAITTKRHRPKREKRRTQGPLVLFRNAPLSVPKSMLHVPRDEISSTSTVKVVDCRRRRARPPPGSTASLNARTLSSRTHSSGALQPPDRPAVYGRTSFSRTTLGFSESECGLLRSPGKPSSQHLRSSPVPGDVSGVPQLSSEAMDNVGAGRSGTPGNTRQKPSASPLKRARGGGAGMPPQVQGVPLAANSASEGAQVVNPSGDYAAEVASHLSSASSDTITPSRTSPRFTKPLSIEAAGASSEGWHPSTIDHSSPAPSRSPFSDSPNVLRKRSWFSRVGLAFAWKRKNLKSHKPLAEHLAGRRTPPSENHSSARESPYTQLRCRKRSFASDSSAFSQHGSTLSTRSLRTRLNDLIRICGLLSPRQSQCRRCPREPDRVMDRANQQQGAGVPRIQPASGEASQAATGALPPLIRRPFGKNAMPQNNRRRRVSTSDGPIHREQRGCRATAKASVRSVAWAEHVNGGFYARGAMGGTPENLLLKSEDIPVAPAAPGSLKRRLFKKTTQGTDYIAAPNVPGSVWSFHLDGHHVVKTLE